VLSGGERRRLKEEDTGSVKGAGFPSGSTSWEDGIGLVKGYPAAPRDLVVDFRQLPIDACTPVRIRVPPPVRARPDTCRSRQASLASAAMDLVAPRASGLRD
jgi:hypothetical protein